jgi:hypothetical protein
MPYTPVHIPDEIKQELIDFFTEVATIELEELMNSMSPEKVWLEELLFIVSSQTFKISLENLIYETVNNMHPSFFAAFGTGGRVRLNINSKDLPELSIEFGQPAGKYLMHNEDGPFRIHGNGRKQFFLYNQEIG